MVLGSLRSDGEVCSGPCMAQGALNVANYGRFKINSGTNVQNHILEPILSIDRKAPQVAATEKKLAGSPGDRNE